MDQPIETFHRAIENGALGEDSAAAVTLNGWPIALCRSRQTVFAVLDRCSHALSDLSSGRVRRGSISCPLHGARFDLQTGRCIGAAYLPLRTFDTRVVEGRIEVAVPETPPPRDR